jgi:nitrate reductase NapE component
MDESLTHETPAEGEGPSGPPPRRRRHWGLILFGVFVILPILAIALWTTVALSWSYSKGTRAGYIQKFSEKGWLCKTWEGEIAMVNVPGAMQERFEFSVRDDSVAHEILRQMGSRVMITYEQHPGVPLRCFGETEYYVTDVKSIP